MMANKMGKYGRLVILPRQTFQGLFLYQLLLDEKGTEVLYTEDVIVY